jgi:hypothetical protein
VRVIGAGSKQLRRNEPRVNLLPALASRRDSRSGRFSPGVLLVAALAAVSWGAAGVGLALLLGWRPGFGVGP